MCGQGHVGADALDFVLSVLVLGCISVYLGCGIVVHGLGPRPVTVVPWNALAVAVYLYLKPT